VANRKVEEQIEQLSCVRDDGPGPAANAALRKALNDRVGLVVAKAAKVALALDARELLPDLAAAFERMFEDPVKRDPQCWAKNAIAQALTQMDYRDSAAYLRGARHIQMEPVWAGQEDTATTLRGICLLGLAACGSDLRRETVFRVLVDGLADKGSNVRAEAVRAVAQMGGDEAPLLLRLKARMGDSELPVVGQVFDCLLQIEGLAAIPFLAEFLNGSSDDVASEAALALGACRLPEAVEALTTTWQKTHNPDLKYAIARALATSRQERAREFLADVAENGRMADVKIAKESLEFWKQNSAANPG
jgi:HEAT repeat protein